MADSTDNRDSPVPAAGGPPPAAGDVRLDRPFLLDGWRVEPLAGNVVPRDGDGGGERLEPKVMAVLVELARHRGRVVSKERLIDEVWPGTHVGEAALSRCISELRRALGDDARNPRFIETLPKRGYRLLAAVRAPEETPAPETGSTTTANAGAAEARVRRTRMNRLVAALLVAAIFIAWWMGRPGDGTEAADAGVDSVAVLPLRALSADAAGRSLAEGLTRQLTTRLAAVEGLAVAASSAAQRLGPDVSAQEAAAALGVDAVLLGSVRVSSERILVILELVHGDTAVDLWAGNFQEIAEDPLEVEAEVAEQAAREIAAALAARAGRPALTPPASPAVRQAMERGRVLGARSLPADALRALDAYREALRLDEDYAPAWAALAEQYAVLGWNHWSPVNEAYGQARTAAYSALDLEPRLPEAHAVLGAVAAEANWDWPEAERFFETALGLGPTSPFVHERYSRHLRRLGRLEEALQQSRSALDLQPAHLPAQVSHGWNLLLSGRGEEAEIAFLQALEMDDDLALAVEGLCAVRALGAEPAAALAPCARAAALPGHEELRGALGYAAARAGDEARARELLEGLRQDYAAGTMGALAEATVLLGLGQRQAALDAVQRAVAGREIRAAAILGDPYLRQLRDEPRLQEQLQRMLLPGAADG